MRWKLRLDDNRVHISVFWLVLAGVAVNIFFSAMVLWYQEITTY